jgi:uncharacterized membrane protein
MSAKTQKQGKKTIKKRKGSKSFIKQLQRFIIASIVGGIVLVLPISLLYASIRFIWLQAQKITRPLKNLIEIDDNVAAWVVDIAALGAILIAFFILGVFVQTKAGKEFWNYIDRLLDKIPFYSIIRDTIRQFFGKNEKMPFSEVVEVDVFNTGTRMIGFLSDQMEDGRYSVFVPTGPNPTNGFIFLVDKNQLTLTEIRPEEAMRIVVGVGTGASEFFSRVKTKR